MALTLFNVFELEVKRWCGARDFHAIMEATPHGDLNPSLHPQPVSRLKLEAWKASVLDQTRPAPHDDYT